MPTYIYGLKDPNTQEIRYIGKSDNPKKRYASHLALSKADVNKHKKRWIASLKRTGQKPELVILERISDKQWQDRECWWIQHGRDSGWKLTNIADGGNYNMSGSTDSIFELIDTLGDYVDADTAAKLKDMSPEMLFSIAHHAAMEGVKVGRGYFNNRVDGGMIYDTMRRSIWDNLG
jgi:hypothetical protein